MLQQVDATLLHAAVELASAANPSPTLQQVINQYKLLAKVIDTTPPPRPVADPSAYTATRGGG